MAIATENFGIGCPRCRTQIDSGGIVDSRCSCFNCGWKGQALLFHPIALEAESAQQALQDDAACVHHPTKRAVHICAGTGDYICALCAIEIEGDTFSTQYLDTVGKDKASKAFDRYLARPDRAAVLYMGLCFVPYVNFFWMMGMPVWAPLGYLKLIKANKLRHQDPLFGKLVSRRRLITIGILLTLFTVICVTMFGFLIVAIIAGL